MELKGRLVQKLPVVTGQGRNGEWKKQDVVLETEGTYPKKVCITVWGDRVNVAALAEGSMLNASIDIESREYNGKWFTNVTAWKIEAAGETQDSQPPLPPMDAYDAPGLSNAPDDMPF